MIFTCEEKPSPWDQADKARWQYIKDDKGYIIGSIYPEPQGGWTWQSCVHERKDSWSDPHTPPEANRMEAINAAIADYIARRMEWNETTTANAPLDRPVRQQVLGAHSQGAAQQDWYGRQPCQQDVL